MLTNPLYPYDLCVVVTFVKTDGSFAALVFYSNDDAETAQVSRARGPAAYLEDVTE